MRGATLVQHHDTVRSKEQLFVLFVALFEKVTAASMLQLATQWLRLCLLWFLLQSLPTFILT